MSAIDRLLLDGKKFTSKVHNRIVAADNTQSIEGTGTLTLGLFDPDRVLLESKIFGARVTTQLDDFSFELVQLRKEADHLILTFEDLPVAVMRRHKKPKKVAPGTMTREQFARSLVREVKWLKFKGPSGKQPRTKIEMSRGKTKDGGAEKGENTWDCLLRLAQEVNWRRFVVGDKVFFLPEKELMEGPADYVLSESKPGVNWIDFDFDIGKPVSVITASVQADRWSVPPGTLIKVEDQGPASGRYLVSNVQHSLFQTHTTVTAKKPDPALPEPDPPPMPDESYGEGPGSGSAPTGKKGKGDWVWPAQGTVTSEFGPRSGGTHYGIDIANALGTPIVAARNGVVIFAGAASGYGKAVYIDHGGGVICRYGHMRTIECSRGQSVKGGQRIAGMGAEGNSTGSHLHFEYRPGDSPRNPREILT